MGLDGIQNIVPFFFSLMYLQDGETKGKLDLHFISLPLLYISRPTTATFIYNIYHPSFTIYSSSLCSGDPLRLALRQLFYPTHGPLVVLILPFLTFLNYNHKQSHCAVEYLPSKGYMYVST